MTVTRFAPSPTGFLHAGNLRTAVLNWLLARQAGGHFILRIDDTDAARSEARFADAIRRDLDWLGLDWDAEVRQSDRLDLYHAAAERLRGEGRLYDCYETAAELELRRKVQLSRHLPPVYDRAALSLTDTDRARLTGEGRAPHWRFLLEPRAIEWTDLIRGAERVEASSLSDPVLIREDGQLLYTLASVVDDADLGVTHVVRGADHVTNTGAQIQIFEALGAAPPAFGHHSLLTAPEGEALSKRIGSLSVGKLAEAGIEPMALLSFLARLGSAQSVEVVTDRAALVESFRIDAFGSSPTRFDPAELAVHSAKTVKALPFAAVAGRLAEQGVPDGIARAFWDAVGPNLDRVAEAAEWWAICRDGALPSIAPEDAEYVAGAMALLPPPPWDATTWKSWTDAVKAASGRKGKALFLPLRRALTGQDEGPDMSALMPLMRAAPRVAAS